MSDFADLAAEREQQLRDDAVDEHARQYGKREVSVSAEVCAVCGDRIPEKRRIVVPGVQTCMPCQRDLEAAVRRNCSTP